jgi:flagellin-like protein
MLENFIFSLEIMWKGMSGIFTVIILIMLIVMGITYITNRNKPS